MSKVELTLSPAAVPVNVRIDATRAHQLLLNLCVNAQDAMPDGGQLTLGNSLVELSPAQAAKVHAVPGALFVRCKVSDTGTGIPAEILQLIFDPFFTTKAKGKGTGLGLSIVHSVVAQAGGFLEVESAPGKGTSFLVHFPSVDDRVTASTPAENGPMLKGTGRVLVVDDLDLVQEFTRTFLTAAGYDVLVASTADEALDVLQSQAEPIDVLFTDYNMPGKSGRQLMHEVSARWPKMKLILVSGYLEESDRRQIEEQYGAHILNKPFNISEAADLIAEILAKS